MKKRRTETLDFISELPDPLLHHIFLSLPYKQIVQTSVLSKRWERVWCTYPVVELNTAIVDPHPLNRLVPIQEFRKRRKKLFKSIERSIRNCICRDGLSMKRFELEISFFRERDPLVASFLEQCVCYAVASNVHELKLRLGFWSTPWSRLYSYDFPQIIFGLKSLFVLELFTGHVASNAVNLSSLRKLSLWRVQIEDNGIKSLAAGCPLVEEMSLEECYAFQTFEISGLKRINHIRLQKNVELECVEIKESNVQFLSIHGVGSRDGINKISCCCRSLTRLELRVVFIDDMWLSNVIPKLPLLEHLELHSCNNITCAEVSSQSIQKLFICWCKNLAEVKLDALSLSYFCYSGVAVPFSSNTSSLSKVDLYLSSDKKVSYEKNILFLANFCHPVDMELATCFTKVVVPPRKFRQTLPSPLHGVKLLDYQFNSTQSRYYKIKDVADGLLWTSPHLKSLIISYLKSPSEEYIIKMQISYKKPVIDEDGIFICCKSRPVSCWQHCIDEVELEIANGSDLQQKVIKTCTLKGGDVLDKISDACQIIMKKRASG